MGDPTRGVLRQGKIPNRWMDMSINKPWGYQKAIGIYNNVSISSACAQFNKTTIINKYRILLG